MRVEWTFPAESYFDQLPPEEQSKVLHAVSRLTRAWDSLLADGHRLIPLKPIADDGTVLYSLRAGADLRVLVSRNGDIISVVDVIPYSQIDGLRRIGKQHVPAAE